jgi:hypothetical protein
MKNSAQFPRRRPRAAVRGRRDAGNDEDRHRKWCQQRSQMLVIGGFAVIDEIAGDDRDIGQRIEPVDLSDRTRQEFGGIEPAVEQLARR